MIKANELKLGNWVLPAGETRKAQVIGIKHKTVWLKHPHSTQQLDSHHDADGIDVEPVFLTPAILEAVGFKLTGSLNFNYTTYHLVDNDCWLMNVGFDLSESIWGYFIQTSANKPEWFQLAEIKYLHQLQNLYFARTGEELNIKL